MILDRGFAIGHHWVVETEGEDDNVRARLHWDNKGSAGEREGGREETNFDRHVHAVTGVERTFELNGCPAIFFTAFESNPVGGGVVDHGLRVANGISVLEGQFACLIDPAETNVGACHATS